MGDFEQTWRFDWPKAPLSLNHRMHRMQEAKIVKNLRGDYPEFAYMCGIVWNRINDAQIDYSLTDETVKVYTEYEADERAIEAYEIGAGLRSNSEALVDSEPF